MTPSLLEEHARRQVGRRLLDVGRPPIFMAETLWGAFMRFFAFGEAAAGFVASAERDARPYI
jgi:hypothetical protein